jgi:protein involved in polysaccharide export with SLBB domain
MLKALLVVVCLLAAACRNQAQLIPLNVAAAPVEETTFGPGDVFDVRVAGQSDLTGKYRVGADGTVQFPFLGPIQAGGKKPDEVGQLIASGLKSGGYLNEPQVTVLIEQINSKRLSVLGAVAQPGTLPIVPGMTVIEAISQVGGFTPLADKDATVLTRQIDGKRERFRVPVSEIARGTTADIPLRANDIVFVPERVF